MATVWRKGRRPLMRFVVAMGAMLLALGMMQQPAMADDEELPAAPEAHNRWYDGCSSPFGNAPGGNDFTDACNWHDLCYGGYIAGHGRAACDTRFHEFMDTICYYNYGNGSGCRAWSAAYYTGVVWFGASQYWGPYWPYYP